MSPERLVNLSEYVILMPDHTSPLSSQRMLASYIRNYKQMLIFHRKLFAGLKSQFSASEL